MQIIAWVLAAAIAVLIIAGTFFGMGAIGMLLYDHFAPDAWVRPAYLHWVGIAFLVEAVGFKGR